MKNKKSFYGLILFSTILINNIAIAQVNIPSMPFKSQAEVDNYKTGCDYNKVYQPLYNKWVTAATAVNNNVYKPQIKDQVLNAPSAQGSKTCLEGAISSINGVASKINTVMSILGGNIDFNSVASSIGTAVGNMACNQVSNYANNAVNSATSGINNVYNQGMSGVNNAGINTGMGNVNVGNSVLGAVKQTPNGGVIPLLK